MEKEMSEYQPLRSASEADLLDMDDCVAGYRSGLHGESEPGSDKSKSFWHGWRNGMIDSRRAPIDEACVNLAREIVARQRAH
jgi:hypothetical protein